MYENSYQRIFLELVIIFVYKAITLFLSLIQIDIFSIIVITEKLSIHGRVTRNGISIPCQLKQTKYTQIWHLRFRPYEVGTDEIYLFHDGLSIMSKQSVDMFHIILRLK